MADQLQRYQFGFRNVELFKEDTLGTGSYGGVCKAKCDGLPCAAKIMHRTLFDLRDPGTVSYLRKFEEECRLLSLARHPNVVQYIGTYRDPDTRLPVLLMELCDESLCRFLGRSPRLLPYHIQLNIAHDIVLALVYLHLNGLTHRDLTGNNVLMFGGVRAKVTDFGMSKLASVNPRTTPMTLCPGNVQYMSPEALEEPPSYTDKLDVFSFGVLLVQIMTRQFPNPGPRFQDISVPNYPEGTIRMAVPETQRRSSHLRLVTDTHPLKAIAISCLKDKERARPSAQQLSSTLSELKQVPEYTESLKQAQTGEGGEGEAGSLRSQVRDLQQQNHTHIEEIEHLRGERDTMAAQVQQLEQQLQDQRVSTEAKTREVLQVEREERQTQKLPTSEKMPKTAAATSYMRWEDGRKAPEAMSRGSAVVDGNTVYINPRGSNKIYTCQITSREQQWFTLHVVEYNDSSLAIIDGVVISVGGCRDYKYTNSLRSLTGRGARRQWSLVFPAMPTARSQTVSVTTQHTLIVAGGRDSRKNLDIVEVMDIPTQQWTTASHLPHPFDWISGTVCGDKLFLAGGFDGERKALKSVLTCSVSDLSPPSLGARPRSLSLANKTGVWQQVRDLPVTMSTLITLGGHLLAVGGRDDSGNDAAAVHCYDSHTDSWHVVSEMKNRRRRCLVSALPEDCLLVVGGLSDSTVEIASQVRTEQ